MPRLPFRLLLFWFPEPHSSTTTHQPGEQRTSVLSCAGCSAVLVVVWCISGLRPLHGPKAGLLWVRWLGCCKCGMEEAASSEGTGWYHACSAGRLVGPAHCRQLRATVRRGSAEQKRIVVVQCSTRAIGGVTAHTRSPVDCLCPSVQPTGGIPGEGRHPRLSCTRCVPARSNNALGPRLGQATTGTAQEG